MIKADFIKKNDYYFGFSIKGHVGFADYGEDIVCSAVSALAINTANSIEELTDDKFSCDAAENGDLDFKIISDVSSDSKLLIHSLYIGLTNIEKEYGQKFLKVCIKEV